MLGGPRSVWRSGLGNRAPEDNLLCVCFACVVVCLVLWLVQPATDLNKNSYVSVLQVWLCAHDVSCVVIAVILLACQQVIARICIWDWDVENRILMFVWEINSTSVYLPPCNIRETLCLSLFLAGSVGT